MSDPTSPPPSSERPSASPWASAGGGLGAPARTGPLPVGVRAGFRPNGASALAWFVGGLGLVAVVSVLVLAARPSPSSRRARPSAGAYDLPAVVGVVRRRPGRAPAPASAPAAPGPTSPTSTEPVARPDVSPPTADAARASVAAPEAPAAPVFAPARSPALPTPTSPPSSPPSSPPDATPPGAEPPSGSVGVASREPTAPASTQRDPSVEPTVPAPSTPEPGLPPPPPVAEGTEAATPVFAVPSTSRPRDTVPTPAPTVEGPKDWLLLLTGDGAEKAAADALRLIEDRRLVTPKGRPVRFSPRAGEAADAREGVRFVVDRGPSSLTLTEIRLPEPLDDPVGSLVPPVGLVADVLVGLALEVPAASQPAALAAMALLLSGDGTGAAGLLDAKATAPGLRVLLAYATLLNGQLPKVHDLVFGLGDDPALGAAVRFLTGAALLADRNPREAMRDFQAALRLQPAFWPARLLDAEANARLDLPEAAAKGFAEVLAAVPDRPEAILAHAFYLAGKDRPAAVAAVTRLSKARPDLVPAWWMLGWIRRQGDTSEDARAEVKAFETVVFLRPKDPEAWRELGTAQLHWADVAGGLDARRAAAAAFAEQVRLRPKDGLAWFNRGSVLHQLATEVSLAGDADALGQRLAEVRTCYARAIEAASLGKADTARVHHNRGLLIDLLPSAAGGDTAGAAYQAAVDADPTYAQGALALVAARVAERNGAAAAKALARVPADADATERSVLTAAVRWVSGDASGAASALRAAGESPQASGDLALRVLGGLVVTGYRRAALTHLEAEPPDGSRLTLRVRARAALRDVAGLHKDLAALSDLDPKLAERLRERDPEVVATLGPAAAGATLKERLR